LSSPDNRSPSGMMSCRPRTFPIDFEVPTIVEIDGKKFSVKATDPESRKKAEKAGLLKVWVEEIAVPVVEEHPEEGEAEEQEEVASPSPQHLPQCFPPCAGAPEFGAAWRVQVCGNDVLAVAAA
jgi:hypothetical protein